MTSTLGILHSPGSLDGFLLGIRRYLAVSLLFNWAMRETHRNEEDCGNCLMKVPTACTPGRHFET